MRKLEIPTAKNLTTGEVKQINVDPHVYTSVHQWIPITPDKFAELLHGYTTSDPAINDFGHGEMSFRSMHLGEGVLATIHSIPRSVGDNVGSAVLMSLSYATGKRVFFASLRYGVMKA